MAYDKTVENVDLNRFMGDWYVLAGRFTFLEKGAHNAVETYSWNAAEKRIDIDFSFNKGSFEGSRRSIPQKGWPQAASANAKWIVSPFWPLKFDYLVIDLAEDYSWTAIGVPGEKYLWIMARTWKNSEAVVATAIQRLREKRYNVDGIVTVPHRW